MQVKLGEFPFLVKTWYTWQTKHNLFIGRCYFSIDIFLIQCSSPFSKSELYPVWEENKSLLSSEGLLPVQFLLFVKFEQNNRLMNLSIQFQILLMAVTFTHYGDRKRS